MAKANEPSEPRVKQEDKLSSFTCAGAAGSLNETNRSLKFSLSYSFHQDQLPFAGEGRLMLRGPKRKKKKLNWYDLFETSKIILKTRSYLRLNQLLR